MHPTLAADLHALHDLIEAAAHTAADYLTTIDNAPPAVARPTHMPLALPDVGMGAREALALFGARYGDALAASSGPRYWGFVTGGTTPAALIGDWLVSALDTNLADRDNSAAPFVEAEAVGLLRALFGLPDEFDGVFVSGATTSNFVGLATGREWASRQLGYSAANDGLFGRPAIPALSAAAHSSAYKALAMLGFGRSSVIRVPALGERREAVDVGALRAALAELRGAPAIVIANAGTVNTADFDDLRAIATLKAETPFWLHIDAAFGGFAACSPRFAGLVAGLELADSLTIDAHKWLNVPYDSAMIFARREHRALQTAVFQNMAAYLPELGDEPDYLHLTPENSRRFRALPAWFTLLAYGRDGYREIVERDCALAAALGERVAASAPFRLLAPVRLNIVCFTLADASADTEGARAAIAHLLARLRDDGRLFLTPTTLWGVPAIRAAFSNWRTTPADLDLAWEALCAAAGDQGY